MTILHAWLFSTDAIPLRKSYFGGGYGLVFQEEITCTGREEGLLECTDCGTGGSSGMSPNCSLAPFRFTDCSVNHDEDAGVICEFQGV